MRILQVHKYLYRKAGAEAYVLDLVEMLKAHGHEVMMWGTNEKCKIKNVKLKMPEDLLVEPLNFDRREGVWRDLKKFGHMVWSFEAARKFEEVLKQFRPEIVHVHNIYHHISPSILAVAARYRVPVVMTVHDYHLVNPNYTLYDHGKICQRRGLSAIAHRCIKNSFAASAADVLEWQIHQWLGIYQHTIARYLTPTEFVKEKLVEGGVDAGKIQVVPLPVAPSHPPEPPLGQGGKTLGRGGNESISPPLGGGVRGGQAGGYIFFAGRLVEEKGIYLVLELATRLPEIQFKIAGGDVSIFGGKNRDVPDNVEFLGFLEKEILQGLIAGARLVIVPSLWYDPSPLAVLEAMAVGKAVVASKIGGIPELIEDGKTGILIPSPGLRPPSPRGRGDGGDGQWIDAIKKIYCDEKLLARVGKAAQEYVKRVHGPEEHYKRLMEIYEETINRTHRTY